MIAFGIHIQNGRDLCCVVAKRALSTIMCCTRLTHVTQLTLVIICIFLKIVVFRILSRGVFFALTLIYDASRCEGKLFDRIHELGLRVNGF